MTRLLPEWCEQWGVLLAWPDAETDWAPFLAEVEPVYLELITQVARRERALVLVRDAGARARVLDRLPAGVRRAVRCVECPYDDTWTRDYGPLAVSQVDATVLCDFVFDGWGGKYGARRDDAVTRRLYELGVFGTLEVRRFEQVLEGGAVESNGAGTLLCNRDTFEARLPRQSREETERWMKDRLGAESVLWISGVMLAGDDTDGHIDTLARFCAPQRIAYQSCDDPGDVNFAALRRLEEQLRTMRTAAGEHFELHPLPWPGAIFHEDARLPASYANFLVVNGAVLAPQFGDPADAAARTVLGRAFPGREIVGVHATPLLKQFGGLHCITLQLPAVPGMRG